MVNFCVIVSLYLVCFSRLNVVSTADSPTCDTSLWESQVDDCRCEFKTVNEAVQNFFAPVLANITSSPFYRYFRIDFGRSCPFWKEEGQCSYEGCSVGSCPVTELPSSWFRSIQRTNGIKLEEKIEKEKEGEYGWISLPSKYGAIEDGGDDELGRLDTSGVYGFEQFLNNNENDDHDQWIDMTETEDYPLTEASGSIFVNLITNPERFTGYSGDSARRVWLAMSQENCFTSSNTKFGSSLEEEQCLEKRVFFRLMSGMQASISTQISKQYYNPDIGWYSNHTLFHRAVGAHPMRVNNMYFGFLFLLRAVSKAGEILLLRPLYGLGGEEEEEERNEIKTWIQALVSTPVSQSFSDNHSLSSSSSSSSSLSSSSSVPHNAIKQCREAFDESSLFQVSDSLSNDSSSSSLYWRQLYEKQQLREDFRTKFRNISRILDCVTCEKCRMWSKLQVMGMGTAIRILLTSNDDLKIAENMAIKEQENLKYINNEDVIEKPKSCSSESVWSPSRQEVVALLHALNQLAKSIVFASTSNINLDNKMNEIYNQVMKEKDEKEKKLKQNFSDIKNVKMKDTEKDDEDNKHKTLKPITTS